MRIKAWCLALMCVLSIAVSAENRHVSEIQRDSLMKVNKVVYFGQGENPHADSLRAVIDMFYYDQFRNFNDPRAPYFLFISKDSHLAMGIGGVVRMRGWYDWGGAMNTNGFIPYDISIPTNPANDRWLGSTPAGSALFFKVIGDSKKFGSYQFYLEANFNGYNARDFHLEKAYAMFGDYTVGYTNSAFSDPAAVPLTVDAQGPNSKINSTTIQARYSHSFKKKKITLGASIEMPHNSVDANNTSTLSENSWFPDVAGFLQYDIERNQHVRLAGIMRVLPYRDLTTATNHSVVGWGAHLSSVFQINTPITIYASANVGKGIGSITNDLILGSFDLVNSPTHTGKMVTPLSFGYYGAFQYHFRPNLFSTAVFGQECYRPEGSVAGSTYKYGLYSALNIFWNITPRCEVGGEINLGKRCNYDGSSNWARRVSVMVQFSF